MQTFTANEAKTRFGELLDRVQRASVGAQVFAPTEALSLSGDLQGSGGPQAMSHQVMP